MNAENTTADGQADFQSPATMKDAFSVFFRQTSPLILCALTVIFTVLRFHAGNWSWLDAIAPTCILLFWPVMEWGIHIYILHYKPIRVLGRKIDFLLPQTHRDHHTRPWDLKRVFIPLHVFPLAAPALVAAAWLIFPTLELAYSALAFYFLLALNYEFCHYLAHIRWCPPMEYYRRRVRQHRYHHFKHERLWWGVSMGMGDVLFGTAPDPDKVSRSQNTSHLLGRWSN